MDSTIIAAIITGVAILLAAIIPILRNKPGQKKLTRARLIIWGITSLAVGAIWLLPYFYINRGKPDENSLSKTSTTRG